MENKKDLPNAVGILILGILSIVTCICYGFVGLILGIISLVMASSALKELTANPEGYTASSVSNVKAGKVCAIIGVILSSLMLIFVIIAIIINAAEALNIF